jgi:cysteinyl-tRNA synthetase
MLQVEGKKMSKSLGNFFTVRDLLDQGIPGEVIRYVFLMTHYRSPMDWTAEKVNEARGDLSRWRAWTRNVLPTRVAREVIDAFANDLNTWGALTELRNLAKAGRFGELKASAMLLGLLEMPEEDWSKAYVYDEAKNTVYMNMQTSVLGRDWLEKQMKLQLMNAREDKDWERADIIKAGLKAAGIEVRISKYGVELVPGPDFDPAKLEALR